MTDAKRVLDNIKRKIKEDEDKTNLLNRKRNFESLYYDMLTTQIFGEPPKQEELPTNVLYKIVSWLKLPKQIEIATFVANKGLRKEILHKNSIILFTGVKGAGMKGDGKYDCHGGKWKYRWMSPTICPCCVGLIEGIYMYKFMKQVYYDHVIELFEKFRDNLQCISLAKQKLSNESLKFQNEYDPNDCICNCNCNDPDNCICNCKCDAKYLNVKYETFEHSKRCHVYYNEKRDEKQAVCNRCMGYIGPKENIGDWFKVIIALGVSRNAQFGGQQLVARINQYIFGGPIKEKWCEFGLDGEGEEEPEFSCYNKYCFPSLVKKG